MSTKEVCEPNFQALQDTLDVIGSKWRVQILASICVGGNNRFREIERSIPGTDYTDAFKRIENNGVSWAYSPNCISIHSGIGGIQRDRIMQFSYPYLRQHVGMG